MTAGSESGVQDGPVREPDPAGGERYAALQTGYREALLVQLDLLVTELVDEGGFSGEQVRRAVDIRLEGGPDCLRGSKLAEERQPSGSS